MITWVSALLIGVTVFLTPLQVTAQEGRSRSVLVLDQSDLRGPFYYPAFAGVRSALSADDRSHITLYAESLDLSRFRGTNYEAIQQRYSIAAVLLIQAGLIWILPHERYRRANAERESRNRRTELVHANRQATAGELSSTIAHALNQSLGTMLTNTETAELILKSPAPNLSEIILADIRRDDTRASEIIHRMRRFLRRVPFQDKATDLSDTMREVFDFLSVQASARNVAPLAVS